MKMKLKCDNKKHVMLGIIPNTSNGNPLGLGISKQSHANPRKVSIKDTTKSYAEALQDLS